MDYSVYIKRTADFELGTLELSNIADNMKGVICSGMPATVCHSRYFTL